MVYLLCQCGWLFFVCRENFEYCYIDTCNDLDLPLSAKKGFTQKILEVEIILSGIKF
jgi:hypothetical protein